MPARYAAAPAISQPACSASTSIGTRFVRAEEQGIFLMVKRSSSIGSSSRSQCRGWSTCLLLQRWKLLFSSREGSIDCKEVYGERQPHTRAMWGLGGGGALVAVVLLGGGGCKWGSSVMQCWQKSLNASGKPPHAWLHRWVHWPKHAYFGKNSRHLTASRETQLKYNYQRREGRYHGSKVVPSPHEITLLNERNEEEVL